LRSVTAMPRSWKRARTASVTADAPLAPGYTLYLT
jgi:hypothetical protein